MYYSISIKIIILVSTITLSACRPKVKPEIKTNQNTIFQTKELIGEKIPIDELIPSGIIILDTFFVVFNRKEEKMLKIYSAKTYQLLDTFLSKGRGPEEMQILGTEGRGFCENGDSKLWIKAFPNYIGLLNINKSLKADQPVYDQMFNFFKDRKSNILYTSNAIYNIGDSTFLLTKDPERSSASKQNPNPFYVKYNYSTNRFSDTLYLSNYHQVKELLPIKSGDQCIRPDFKKTIKAYTYINQILISNIETKKQLWLTKLGYLPTIEEMSIDKEQYHVGTCCTQDFFLVSCARRYDNKGNIPKRYLEVYDWDGNLLWHLDIKQAVWYPYIDEVNGYLYSVNEDDEIWRYDIQDILQHNTTLKSQI